MSVRPAKTQIRLGIRPVWSESSLSAWRNLGSLATHCAHSEDSDQTGPMPRLIWVFARCTVILLVLSWGSLNNVHHCDLISANDNLGYQSLWKPLQDRTDIKKSINSNQKYAIVRSHWPNFMWHPYATILGPESQVSSWKKSQWPTFNSIKSRSLWLFSGRQTKA